MRALLALTAVLTVVAAAPAQGPQHCRLVWTESPQSRVVVSWSTLDEGEDHRVRYDTVARGGDLDAYAHQTVCQKSDQFSSGRPEVYYHHAQLEGLEPSTTYYLVMESDGAASREFHFVTAPADDRPFSILHGGDSRSDPEARRAMNRRIAALADADDRILAFAHGGDYIYFGFSLVQWVAWLSDHEHTVTERGRMLPIIPARGNHEAWGALYDEVFAWPGGGFGQNYFTTELSPEVVLVTLNTEIAAGGKQTKFLKATLGAHADKRWKLVQYHRPIFPGVKLPSRAKRHWQPLFDAHEVDLVCESDGHVLKRTPPIRGDAPHEDGVVYIGEGGLGVPQRTPLTGRWYLEPPGFAGSAHHVWELRFGTDALEMRAITLEGEVADEYALKPRG